MAEFEENVRFECVVIRETALAVLVTFGEEIEKWIPKSQIDDRSEVYKLGDSGEIIISQWFADKERIS